MSEEVLINVTPQETRIAMMENGVVQELQIERSSSLGLVGNIYRGVVCRVLPGMQSAFVEVGLQRAAFLHAGDVLACGDAELKRPIQEVLHEGQSVMVQVIKEPIGTKGARLTTQISIAGRFLVYLPQQEHIGVSQRIEVEAERESLKARLLGLLPAERVGGYIIRTMSEAATDEELLADIDYLNKTWMHIKGKSITVPERTLIFQDLNLPMRVLRDVLCADTEVVRVDSSETYQKLVDFSNLYAIAALDKLVHYQGERPLFDLYNIEQEIEKAMSRKVELKSGGYLIFDQTEALTTVDVNTGSFVSGKNLSDTIFKTNLEAAQSIARQLRLRNLGGIIIIDFIDMDEDVQRAAVLEELQKAVSRDRARTGINGFTPLGLVEMTRKRTRESLAHILCEPCSTCKGRGELKTAQTVCYEILRELLREARQFSARELRVLAAPKVIEMLLDEESQSLANLSDFIAKPISLQVETSYGQESFDIILM
ncbi:MAG: ribonuclease G [Methylotenera sp.]|uniref:Ribonuclease G n=1 Tax=Methylotenera mobilis TaxID=359408 RepID=A0A351RA32_9PROT|nr:MULTISPECIES: ribonuclease G [Methylotenera]HBA08903.1 ribonuclease G [Methylotenera mobilis]MDP3778372.1 ribonuclease G [Methylotenera sp.]PPC96676.1 MAG: ribonuclease G [Methylotenera sp.]PPD00981.1 MAG: ribonuclease G [Methylotenera sp.]PPD46331.1 MAG: ribonuclease G [Methylotenera sp.]